MSRAPIPRAPHSLPVPEGSGELLLRYDGRCVRVVARRGRVRLGVSAIEEGEIRELGREATVQLGDARLQLRLDGPAPAAEPEGLPSEVELEFLPRGGRLHLRWGGQSRSTYLGDRRCDLAAVLLQPPRPHRPGEMLPDALIKARVWPRVERSRNDLNTLVYRLRQTLSRIDPAVARLVTRAPGGQGTCFRVSPATRIAVR